MYNDLFSIGPLTIHGYGLMTAIGILSAYFTAEYRAKKKGLKPEKILDWYAGCDIGLYRLQTLIHDHDSSGSDC